jgi:hypothetical protein
MYRVKLTTRFPGRQLFTSLLCCLTLINNQSCVFAVPVRTRTSTAGGGLLGRQNNIGGRARESVNLERKPSLIFNYFYSFFLFSHSLRSPTSTKTYGEATVVYRTAHSLPTVAPQQPMACARVSKIFYKYNNRDNRQALKRRYPKRRPYGSTGMRRCMYI